MGGNTFVIEGLDIELGKKRDLQQPVLTQGPHPDHKIPPAVVPLLTFHEDDGLLIHNVKFRTRFEMCRMSDGYAIKYLQERWTWLNNNLFNGDMKMPQIERINKKGILAFFSPLKGLIGIGDAITNTIREDVMLGTLLHEMCHQWIRDIWVFRDQNPTPSYAHGPEWVAVMHRVGLNAEIKFEGDSNRSFMTAEKEQAITQVANKEKVPYGIDGIIKCAAKLGAHETCVPMLWVDAEKNISKEVYAVVRRRRIVEGNLFAYVTCLEKWRTSYLVHTINPNHLFPLPLSTRRALMNKQTKAIKYAALSYNDLSNPS